MNEKQSVKTQTTELKKQSMQNWSIKKQINPPKTVIILFKSAESDYLAFYYESVITCTQEWPIFRLLDFMLFGYNPLSVIERY